METVICMKGDQVQLPHPGGKLFIFNFDLINPLSIKISGHVQL